MLPPEFRPANAAAAAVRRAVDDYRAHASVPRLLEALDAVCAAATPEELAPAVEPFLDIPEVAGPVYERIVAARPDDARALVILGNAYWLAGRGPDVVGELASRAIAADPANRGAWHLWALTESNPRRRTDRWLQVSKRFPADDLAKANLADNAASLAGAENDPVALKLAIATYEQLHATAQHPQQREALSAALRTLKAWKV
ncbi:MAG: hypothetical protein AVDCRST_MAG11-1647 [uncultured Gemmatimonadaceae bacterium]|uniref:Uncharacterized protein n=1 Tax=uncultured Gemmatimonadaceae bacterium TaxID=246130 RepID=A0A6J4KRL3_9BACT|nr:MAG: hypothetical protein AVDCRST_MAG11-1647 [uncultured Gemmatimonadaceae bacterium]